jgi:hypothetical protein
MTNHIYELAKRRTPDNLEFFGVDLVTDPESHSLCVWRGVGHHMHGAQCSAQELLGSWQDHLLLSGAEWLAPVLERFAKDEQFTIQAVLHAYQQHHGHPAPVRDVQ